METTTPDTDAKVGTLHLAKPLESTQAAGANSGTSTSRFPARAQDAGTEGQANLKTTLEDFLSGDWAESARDEIRKHPLAVVGVALVAGLLVGRL